jgi:hypothetical protein
MEEKGGRDIAVCATKRMFEKSFMRAEVVIISLYLKA